MLLNSSLPELKRRETALNIINSKIKARNRSHLYDLTGLSGGFPIKKEDIDLLETYAGSAIFEEEIQIQGKKHLGGKKILALNRTSSGILASILALVKPNEEVVHYLPQLPSHPSIPRSAELIRANYREFNNLNEFEIGSNTSLVIITGSTMDHEVLSEEDFSRIVKISKSKQVPVLVDDASGARLRTVIYHQPRAMDMGANLVITSTDKLMDGPRGGLMSGDTDLIDLVKSKAHQFGLEAQTPLIAGMVRALEDFNPERILKAQEIRKDIYKILINDLKEINLTPTGFMLSPEGLMNELKYLNVKHSLSSKEAAHILAMILLREYNIITIPAVGMPGASPTIRVDLASKDAERLDKNYIIDAFKGSLLRLKRISNDEKACRKVLYD
jgi:L-seryl-tRNA(Ser) seleniumtransferase